MSYISLFRRPWTAVTSAGLLACLLLVGCQGSDNPTPKKSSTTTDSGREEKPAKPAEEKKPAAEEKPAEESKPAEEKPAEPSAEKPAEEAKPAGEDKPTEEKPAPEKSATTDAPAVAAAAAAVAAAAPADAGKVLAINPLKAGDWNQWGGNPHRNNVPVTEGVLTQWTPGEFDRKTGEWKREASEGIRWVANVGSQTYGNPVVASGKILVGTNNSFGYLKRYPSDVDLGCLICFSEADGKFLWQHSSEKLPTGRVHDWPLMGICCSSLIEGDRGWFVTSRGEVRCVDMEGFHDGEDDGPVSNELGRLFDVMKAEDPAQDKVAPIVAGLDEGKLIDDVRSRFAKAGVELPAEVTVAVDDKAKAPSKRWTFEAEVAGAKRNLSITLVGTRLSGWKVITPEDKDEADVIWAFDMMKELGTSQHNMCSCSVTSYGNILFVNTSNGVDEQHITIPSPDAPSFIAMDKTTGKVLWTDNMPRANVLHGQWSSPAVAVIGGVPQVIFGGGDGWVYSYQADEGKEGKPTLLWKFDVNAKSSILELGGRGTRNDIIATPVIYDNKVYFATGQDPEHGEGSGTLWCIDPTKRGDISEELAVNRADPKTPIAVKRIQAVVEADGDLAIANPNSGVVWKYTEQDNDGDGKIDDFLEKFHRSIGTVAIKNDLLFVADFSGLFHCVDAQTGKVNWTYDMLAASWSSTLIAGDHVYIGDEDGDIAVFELKKERHDPIAEINMLSSVYSTPIVANGVLYIGNKDHIFAIAPPKADAKETASK